MSAKTKRGPTREQLTDQQWTAVCGLFDSLQRISKQVLARRAAGAQVSPT